MLDEKLAEFAANPINDAAVLDAWFLSLPGVAATEILGEWRGAVLATGHPGETQLTGMNWVGKKFNDLDDVNPLLVTSPDGKVEVSTAMGAASLKMITVAGVASATMVYDKYPIFDHFRAISSDQLVGRMDVKGDPNSLYFYLTRQP